MTTDARQRLGSILGIAIMVATAAASSGGGARAAGNSGGATVSQPQRSDKSPDATKGQSAPSSAKTDGAAATPPAAPKPTTGPHSEARRGRGHF